MSLAQNDILSITFNYKNSTGLHELIRDTDTTFCEYYVVYQDHNDATKLNLGDYAKVQITNLSPKVIKRDRIYYRKCYAYILEVLITGEELAKRATFFDKLYLDYFPDKDWKPRFAKGRFSITKIKVPYHPLSFARGRVKEDFMYGVIDKLDVETIFRKELFGVR